MTGGEHGVPNVGGHQHSSEAARRFWLALAFLALAGYVWYQFADTGGEILALLTWSHPSDDAARTAWDLAPMAVLMSLLVAMVPASLVLAAAAVGRLKHAATVSGMALTGFTAATVALWLVR